MKSAEWQESLAHAIILQAVRDYRDVRKILRKYPEHDLSLKLKADKRISRFSSNLLEHENR